MEFAQVAYAPINYLNTRFNPYYKDPIEAHLELWNYTDALSLSLSKQLWNAQSDGVVSAIGLRVIKTLGFGSFIVPTLDIAKDAFMISYTVEHNLKARLWHRQEFQKSIELQKATYNPRTVRNLWILTGVITTEIATLLGFWYILNPCYYIAYRTALSWVSSGWINQKELFIPPKNLNN